VGDTLDSYSPGSQAAPDAYKNGTFGFRKRRDLTRRLTFSLDELCSLWLASYGGPMQLIKIFSGRFGYSTRAVLERVA
jgi:hypothetical protein